MRWRFTASFGLSTSSWVICILPLRSYEVFVCRRLPQCLSLHMQTVPGSSQSSFPECMTLYMVLQLTERGKVLVCSSYDLLR